MKLNISFRFKTILYIFLLIYGVKGRYNLTLSLCTADNERGIADNSGGRDGHLWIRVGHQQYQKATDNMIEIIFMNNHNSEIIF